MIHLRPPRISSQAQLLSRLDVFLTDNDIGTVARWAGDGVEYVAEEPPGFEPLAPCVRFPVDAFGAPRDPQVRPEERLMLLAPDSYVLEQQRQMQRFIEEDEAFVSLRAQPDPSGLPAVARFQQLRVVAAVLGQGSNSCAAALFFELMASEAHAAREILRSIGGRALADWSPRIGRPADFAGHAAVGWVLSLKEFIEPETERWRLDRGLANAFAVLAGAGVDDGERAAFQHLLERSRSWYASHGRLEDAAFEGLRLVRLTLQRQVADEAWPGIISMMELIAAEFRAWGAPKEAVRDLRRFMEDAEAFAADPPMSS